MSAKKLRDRLARRARLAGLDLPGPLVDGLEAYFLELARWNARINLTAFSLEGDGSDAAVDRLLIEPVVAARYITADAMSIFDAGSGGGSPAIPMKLARPDLALHMVEVKVRKSVFLRQVSRTLALRDTAVHTARFEELLTNVELHEAMSVVSVRAVRLDLHVLTTLQAFLRPGGQLLNFMSAQTVVPTPLPPLTPASVVELLPGRSRLAIFRKDVDRRRST